MSGPKGRYPACGARTWGNASMRRRMGFLAIRAVFGSNRIGNRDMKLCRDCLTRLALEDLAEMEL